MIGAVGSTASGNDWNLAENAVFIPFSQLFRNSVFGP